MARCSPVARPLVAALLLAVAALAGAEPAKTPDPRFVVTGRVYCDPCRAGFETPVSHAVAGATVTAECRQFNSMQSTLKAEATTNKDGWYQLEVDQDHQEEICEVILVKSSDPECGEIEEFRDRSRVPLTRNNGINQSGLRFANPIAFFRKEPLPECGVLLGQYDLKDASETP